MGTRWRWWKKHGADETDKIEGYWHTLQPGENERSGNKPPLPLRVLGFSSKILRPFSREESRHCASPAGVVVAANALNIYDKIENKWVGTVLKITCVRQTSSVSTIFPIVNCKKTKTDMIWYWGAVHATTAKCEISQEKCLARHTRNVYWGRFWVSTPYCALRLLYDKQLRKYEPSKDTVQYYFMIDTKYGSTKVLSKVQIKLFIRVHVLYCTTTTTVLVSIDRATRTCSSRVALNMIIDNLIM